MKQIETRFRREMIFLQSDEERSFENEFDKFITEKEITHESSTSHISEQNDHSEKKKHILIMKARIMRIKINLSNYLWSWIYQTIDYLMNRILMTKHEWKIPFELVQNKKSFLDHLRKFDCKVYLIHKNLSRKHKLASRAHIEFLIKYDSTNIFMTWVFSEKKMIRTRNAIFDERLFYKKDGELNLMQLINKSIIESSFDVSELFTRVIEVESNDEQLLEIFKELENVHLADKEKRKDDYSGFFLISEIISESNTSMNVISRDDDIKNDFISRSVAISEDDDIFHDFDDIIEDVDIHDAQASIDTKRADI